ncbi:tripartite tricarboxylate transporter TctB family protein [Pseudopelagicola sp. nBUS_19]|uniref:tripartite tricarboxylate transporter TctB family protein n=1 Tax=unclassified Pseudopelagicola TaxID=2649563 RepID=UPI003EBAD2C0
MSTPSLPRVQHIIGSGFVAAVGVWVAFVSFTQQPSEAFLFPRLISSVFVVLAIWTFAKACCGWTKVGHGIAIRQFTNLFPGLAVTLVYIFFAAKGLGFYTSTSIAFFILLSLYDPASHWEVKTWVKRIVITTAFMAVMYALFAILLKVYTPREVLF